MKTIMSVMKSTHNWMNNKHEHQTKIHIMKLHSVVARRAIHSRYKSKWSLLFKVYDIPETQIIHCKAFTVSVSCLKQLDAIYVHVLHTFVHFCTWIDIYLYMNNVHVPELRIISSILFLSIDNRKISCFLTDRNVRLLEEQVTVHISIDDIRNECFQKQNY